MSDEKKMYAESKNISFSGAVPVPVMDKEEIELLIEYAEECLIESTIPENKVNYDWMRQLSEAYYAMGGDYPDDEAAGVAINYAYSCLQTVKSIIRQLPPGKLQKCIGDMKFFMETMF